MAGIVPESIANAGFLLRRSIRDGLRRLLPASCLLCGADAATAICPACAADLPRLPDTRCPLCAIPTTHGERCGRCLQQPPHFDAALALYAYEFPVSPLLQAFKYAGQLAPGNWLGEKLAEACRGWRNEVDTVLALPLHPARLRERGFNQAQELARPVAQQLGLALATGLCERHRATRHQTDLPPKERRGNVRHAFSCREKLSGRRVLLIDDVMTTGSTLDECARILKQHGAASVRVAVVARALRHD